VDLADLRRTLDAALARRPRREASRSDLIAAAVLVPVTAGPSGPGGAGGSGEPHILFSKKSDAVPHHKGQFAFPGGIVEESDGSRVETALREAWEEIRLPADAVEVLGLLDDTDTRATQFVITPVVGIVTRPVAFRPDGREIERVIEVPLRTLRDPAIFRTELWERGGAEHQVHFYDVSVEDIIWGATARILKQFLDIVGGREEAA
jgi:8-oxo-dGTP pyrophosphatase MutT (NUDIX family)